MEALYHTAVARAYIHLGRAFLTQIVGLWIVAVIGAVGEYEFRIDSRLLGRRCRFGLPEILGVAPEGTAEETDMVNDPVITEEFPLELG